MENASKALIIAGAILLSILLISVGIMVVNSAQGTMDQGNQKMQSSEISTFNSTFTAFQGQHKTASQVKNLYDEMKANNAKNDYSITMTVDNVAATAATMARLNTKVKYTIVVDDAQGNDGIVDTITVTKE